MSRKDGGGGFSRRRPGSMGLQKGPFATLAAVRKQTGFVIVYCSYHNIPYYSVAPPFSATTTVHVYRTGLLVRTTPRNVPRCIFFFPENKLLCASHTSPKILSTVPFQRNVRAYRLLQESLQRRILDRCEVCHQCHLHVTGPDQSNSGWP